MDRVDDIIAELEIQIDPLKEQSKKANEYLDAKENLKNIEVALLAVEITNINDEYNITKEKIEKLNNEIMNLSLKNNNFDTNLIELKSKLLKIDSTLKELNQNLLVLTREEERLNGEKNIFNERKKYNVSDDKVHKNISNLKEEKLKKENEIFLLDKDIEELNSDVDNLNLNINKILLEMENLKKNRNGLLNDLNNKKINLSDVKHKINIISEFLESGGSYNKAIKSVLNNPRLTGIHQTLGNLIDTEEKYIKAVDIALSSVKQFIVVDNEVSAKGAINYLKDNKLGRATFFPISVIKPRGIDPDVSEILKSDNV